MSIIQGLGGLLGSFNSLAGMISNGQSTMAQFDLKSETNALNEECARFKGTINQELCRIMEKVEGKETSNKSEMEVAGASADLLAMNGTAAEAVTSWLEPKKSEGRDGYPVGAII